MKSKNNCVIIKPWKRRNIKCILPTKRSKSEKATIQHPEKVKTMETEKNQWLPRLGREKNKRAEQRIFRTMKLFYMILQWWIQVIMHVSKSINYRTQKVHPKVNNGLCPVPSELSAYFQFKYSPKCFGNVGSVSFPQRHIFKIVPALEVTLLKFPRKLQSILFQKLYKHLEELVKIFKSDWNYLCTSFLTVYTESPFHMQTQHKSFIYGCSICFLKYSW